MQRLAALGLGRPLARLAALRVFAPQRGDLCMGKLLLFMADLLLLTGLPPIFNEPPRSPPRAPLQYQSGDFPLSVDEIFPTAQIANAIDHVLKPQGVGVLIKATHHCMTVRGVRKPGSDLVTSRMLGCFRDNPLTRQEFLAMAV
jgi:hypothetical protein